MTTKRQVSKLQRRIGQWITQILLPTDSLVIRQHAVIGCIIKCSEELDELTAAPFDPQEAADVVICMFSHAAMLGYDLIDEIHKKMDINEKRRWSGPDANGVIHHVE